MSMQGKVKLSKRQMKEDKFTTFMLTAKSEIMQNWQFAVIGVVIVALVVIGVVYFFNSLQNKHREASVKFANAVTAYRSGSNQAAILGLTEIVENYSGEGLAAEATFLLGKINFDTKNYPEAERYYQQYADKNKEDKLKLAAAIAGVAASLENQGKYEEAKAKYIAAFDAYPDGPLAADYDLSALRMAIKTADAETAKQRLQSIESIGVGNSDLITRAKRIFYEAGMTEPPA